MTTRGKNYEYQVKERNEITSLKSHIENIQGQLNQKKQQQFNSRFGKLLQYSNQNDHIS